jgi:hypothetical protein
MDKLFIITDSYLFLVISFTLFFLSYKTKQSTYFVGGLYICAIIFIGNHIFSSKENLNGPVGIYYSILALIVSFAIVNVAYLEARAKRIGKSVNLRSDFKSALVPSKANIVFWIIILIYYIGVKVLINR